MLAAGLALLFCSACVAATLAFFRRAESYKAIAAISGVAVVLLPAAALWALAAALFVGGMRCDETCLDPVREPGSDWTAYRDSWQWNGQLALAALGTVSAFAAPLAFITHRPRVGASALGLGFGALVVWLAWTVLRGWNFL